MALRPAPQALRRRAGAVPVAKTPSPRRIVAVQRRATGTSSFPFLPAMAAALVLLGAAQLAFWWWQARLPGAPDQTVVASNPFLGLFNSASATPIPTDGSIRPAQRLNVPVLPQNLQFGDALARVTVTVFTDPSCGPCREEVRRWTAGLPAQGVRQVIKFWPSDPARVTPGMLLELARQQGIVPTFWRSLQGAGNMNLDDTRLLSMLDAAGMPLADQRAALVSHGSELTASLEPDIALARGAHLPPPPMLVVDDYVLDGETLKAANLNEYVKKRLEGRPLLEKNDLWLMRK